MTDRIQKSDTNKERKKANIRVIIIVVLLVFIAGLFLFLKSFQADRPVIDDQADSEVSASEQEDGELTAPAVTYPEIGEVKTIETCDALNLDGDVLIIDDFEETEVTHYRTEYERAEMGLSFSKKNDICGRYLIIDYAHENTEGQFHSARIDFFNENTLSLLDEYDHINFVARFEKDTYLIKFFIIDNDGDFWWFQNVKPLKAGTWYWFNIPLEDIYLLEDYPGQGDGVKDFDDRFVLTFEGGPETNVVHFDSLFISKK